jgi:hypothetical protein
MQVRLHTSARALQRFQDSKTAEAPMRETQLTFPELGLIAGTRGMLGAGAGLLLADRMTKDQRQVLGWTLFLIGAISTVPLALTVFSRSRRARRNKLPQMSETELDGNLDPESVAAGI